MSRSAFVPLVILAAALTGACGSNSTTTTSPTPPATVSETFTGTLAVNGSTTWPFAVSQAGTITATLATLSTAGATVGLDIGTWNGTSCQLIIVNDAAVVGATVTGTAGSTGNFCARVNDVGKLTAPTDYTITVTHF